MAWWDLISIQQDAIAEYVASRSAEPTACPNDGEPLERDTNGKLRCRFDGYIWDGRNT